MWLWSNKGRYFDTTQTAIYRVIIYYCSQYDYKITTGGALRQHKETKHECVKYGYYSFDYKVTWQVHLRKHKLTITEGIKYLCKQSYYKTTWWDDPRKHKTL